MTDEQVADQIEGIPHPAQNSKVTGHGKTSSILLEQYASGRMHHAWLLTGPRGIGKTTLAIQMAKHVLRFPEPENAPREFQEAQENDPVSGKIAARSHPNLLHLARPWDAKTKKFRTRLTVDEIRLTVPFFGSSRGESGWRIAIVDPADDMNAAAANALLKILEEPPEQTLFFIICHSPGKLLPTIRSRCQHLAMEPLDDDEVRHVISGFGVTEGMTEKDERLLIELAGGSVRKAIILARGEGLELYRKFQESCSTLNNPDWVKIQALADSVALRGREDKYRLLLQFANNYIETRATGRADEQMPIDVLARWAEVWEKSQNWASLAESYNLDKKQVIINLFLEMGEAGRI